MSDLTLYNITNKFVDLMNKAENEELTEEEYNKPPSTQDWTEKDRKYTQKWTDEKEIK